MSPSAFLLSISPTTRPERIWLTAGDNNVFTQIGLIVLVGLSAKNAILMTSLAFIMGVVPLVLSTGVGAEMRSAMGVTALGLFLTSIFYVLVRRLTGSAVVGNRSQGIGPACRHASGELN